MFENVKEFKKLHKIYVDILKDSIQNVENLFFSELNKILENIEMALNKGFILKNSKLIYEGEIKVKYFTNGSIVIETDNPYYVRNLKIVQLLPLKVVTDQHNHPHFDENGEFCLGDIKSFDEFIKAFPTVVQTVYINSVYRLDDHIKRKLRRLGLF